MDVEVFVAADADGAGRGGAAVITLRYQGALPIGRDSVCIAFTEVGPSRPAMLVAAVVLALTAIEEGAAVAVHVEDERTAAIMDARGRGAPDGAALGHEVPVGLLGAYDRLRDELDPLIDPVTKRSTPRMVEAHELAHAVMRGAVRPDTMVSIASMAGAVPRIRASRRG